MLGGMFCFQCEQTSKMTGCTTFGVCGKDPETAALQDLLLHACRGISALAHRARLRGARRADIDRFVMDALFTTITNVNFDPARLQEWLVRAGEIQRQARELYLAACIARRESPEPLNGATCWRPAATLAESVADGQRLGLPARLRTLANDIASLQELLTYGLKGMAAYAHHAAVPGRESEAFYAFMHEALAALEDNSASADALLALNLRCGEVNLGVMALLDEAHRERFGSPEPTSVRVEPVPGKCILVSGHDLHDLEALLRQTAGKGINIYTHGEMLPAHGYPKLKRFPHLVGNYGGAWQDQRKEFTTFPGAILMTTNCIQKPRESYERRIFTSGVVAWPGVEHVSAADFSPVIEAALAADGFTEAGTAGLPDKRILVGFAHEAILANAGKVVEAVKSGALRHFFLIGGCDGAKPGRNYYTEFAESVPDDCAVLTLGCGKYRFNRHDFGDIGGLPRLLDCGQCNDAYSAIKVAGALAQAFGCGVNDLPLSLVISWFEQKAVAVLLTLLHLGIRNIRLGPHLPAFVSPGVLKILVDTFGLKGITTAGADLEACLAKAA
ncbi:hydroxylamine reductase [Opitutaceae bacterium TAV1]|nr:hydroxylamine reductase [Opitutaceae bacterium TAV1]